MLHLCHRHAVGLRDGVTHLSPLQAAKRAAERERLAYTVFTPFRHLDNGYVKYMVLGSLWAMATWILLTYGMLIRAMQGPDAEKQLISAWGLALVIELVRAPIDATILYQRGQGEQPTGE